jgi:hypothetical protein
MCLCAYLALISGDTVPLSDHWRRSFFSHGYSRLEWSGATAPEHGHITFGNLS